MRRSCSPPKAPTPPNGTTLPQLVQSTHALTPGKTCFRSAARLGRDPSEDPADGMARAAGLVAGERRARSPALAQSPAFGSPKVRRRFATATCRLASVVLALQTCSLGFDRQTAAHNHTRTKQRGTTRIQGSACIFAEARFACGTHLYPAESSKPVFRLGQRPAPHVSGPPPVARVCRADVACP
jgi:hypothetical protein